MGSMFWRASVFNQPLSFDTFSVTNMRYMFNAAPSLSDANKLLIRCAWAGTPAFASAGYGSSWGPGTCPATFTSTAALNPTAYNVSARLHTGGGNEGDGGDEGDAGDGGDEGSAPVQWAFGTRPRRPA
eukprot:scaffold72338_cov51-Phaeocystis_antarctica.AAC.1